MHDLLWSVFTETRMNFEEDDLSSVREKSKLFTSEAPGFRQRHVSSLLHTKHDGRRRNIAVPKTQ
ncbi:hypothetical protein [Maritalea sp.]|uniref:hypothetical protein n=1 Tax=Maritalea sp. TaxID=2003361 RepID=UPI003EF29C5E